jgi:hypothetical protein
MRIGSESVDVYPSDISHVIANGLNWQPRFVVQSCAAYNPALDQRCADNYRVENVPRYILYSHQAISTMHPCIVDVQTRMEIYRWYDVVDQADDILAQPRTLPFTVRSRLSRWPWLVWLYVGLPRFWRFFGD